MPVQWGCEKDPRKANLGRPFEDLIRYANHRYRVDKIAVIHKIPTEFLPIRGINGKVCDVKVVEPAAMDFMGRYKAWPVAFEAKHTERDRIALGEVTDNQTEWLNDWAMEEKALTFVLVSFSLQKFYMVPWEAWKVARIQAHENEKRGKGEIQFSYPTPEGNWYPTGKKSIRHDEMHRAWEIKQGGVCGLDYLKVAKNNLILEEE